MVSAIRVKVIGSMPPAAAPIMKHITRLPPNAGIAPQIAVPMNISADSRIAARRPNKSPSRPHASEPTTVPVSADSARNPAVEPLMPYSAAMPGIAKPIVAGFITSTASAMVSTPTSFQCSRLSGTWSATWNDTAPRSGCAVRRICSIRGIRP
ncbi:hypothetical protein RLIN73S_03193 [Rhodanobacter lindaniclasticus]